MALSTYAELQTTVLGWLARPDDPLVAPAVPDMIRLFEAEASRRLKVGYGEKQVTLLTIPGSSGVYLPADFLEMRQISYGGMPLQYLPPGPLPQTVGGIPQFYSITGPAGDPSVSGYRLARIDPRPETAYELTMLYLAGPPPLSDTNQSNWLLATSPDAYLFGALVEAELYIGHDERVPLWLQRREAAFASIEQADRKARWPGSLQIRVDGISVPHGTGGAGGTASPAAPGPAAPSASGAGITVADQPPLNPVQGSGWWDSSSSPGGGQLYVWYGGQWVAATNQAVGFPEGIATATPGSGEIVTLARETPSLYISSGALAALTVRLWPTPAVGEEAQISFANPVTALSVETSGGVPVVGGPSSAYGPGAALVFRFVAPGMWQYWK